MCKAIIKDGECFVWPFSLNDGELDAPWRSQCECYSITSGVESQGTVGWYVSKDLLSDS